MKKRIASLLSCILLLSLTACGNGTSNEGASPPTQPDEQASSQYESSQESNPPTELDDSEAAQESNPPAEAETPPLETTSGNALVIYFSATGNTKVVAESLAELQGADLYEIVPEQRYTDEDLNYNDPSTRASVEQNDESARPAISGGIDNIEDYDVIYVGFPIWWGDIPRILNTFFDTYDLSGKTIAPFCTSGGSGISRAVQSITELEPSAIVTDGLRANASNAEDDLIQWLNTIGLAKQE